MGKLAEIEAVVESLTLEDKQRLLLYLAEQLRSRNALPSPRKFSSSEVHAWIEEDEAAMRDLRKDT